MNEVNDRTARRADPSSVASIRRQTFTLAEVAGAYLPPDWVDGARWLSRRLNRGDIKGVKLGRTWMMTQAQIDQMLEQYANEVVEPEPQSEPESTETTGIAFADALSPRSRSRLKRVPQ